MILTSILFTIAIYFMVYRGMKEAIAPIKDHLEKQNKFKKQEDLPASLQAVV